MTAGDRRRFNGRTPRGLTVTQRFWSKVEGSDPNGCWLWVASKDSAGYGMFYIGKNKLTRAHRFSYEDMVGEIPTGLHIDHLCRTPACVNPSHLEPVTCRVNMLRGEAPGAKALRRDRCDQGHDFAEWAIVSAGRRICRLCRAAYLKQYRTGLPVDLALALKNYSEREREALGRLSPAKDQQRRAALIRHHGLDAVLASELDEETAA